MDETTLCLSAMLACSAALRRAATTQRETYAFVSTDVLAAHLDVLELEAGLTDCSRWAAESSANRQKPEDRCRTSEVVHAVW